MAEMQKLKGSCHCGAVAYEAEADISTVMECNCSHCERKGFLLVFTPRENFTLLSGEDKLTEYKFNKQHIAHLFCSVCGVESFAYGTMPDGTKMAAINMRCAEGVDIGSLNRKPVDGRSF